MVDSKFVVPLKRQCVYFDPDFLPPELATESYLDLLKNIKWETTSKINRWVSLHHSLDLKGSYQYRDAPGAPQLGFSTSIQRIQMAAQEWYCQQTGQQVEFNVCLLNYYENGQQRIGWHSDREEIGRTTPIASVSLGATRQLQIRNKVEGPEDRVALDMPNGSLVVMENICQHEYLHSVPRQSTVEDGRINLTFRCKEFTTEGEVMHEQRDRSLGNITQGALPDAQAWSSPIDALSSKVFGDDVAEDELDPNFSQIVFLFKTNLGTERYCGAEAQELLDSHNLSDMLRVIARPRQMDGFVACCCALGSLTPELKSETARILLVAKSAQHLLDFHTEFPISDCCTDDIPEPEKVTGEMLFEHFKNLLVNREVVVSSLEKLAENGGGTFRASCDRIGGPHAFQHPEVEREMGGALAEYYESRAIRPKMEDYDVCIRMEVVGYRVIVGTQLNVYDLSKDRHFLKFRNAVAVKTNIAYAMVRLGNIQAGHTVLDPFCGSGTLLLEALEVFQKNIFCIGLDVSKRCAEGARENAQAENCGPQVCKFACSDARGLRKHVADESVDAIITNLPWGVQTGQKNSVVELGTLHEVFLRTAWYTLKVGGRIVMLNLRGLQLMRIVRKLSGRYRLLSVNVIRTTNNLPSIFVIEKLASDTVRESIKSQLSHLGQYVTVGPEMYHALHSEIIDEE
jgi:alkylated DNA repair dioxygenase AlkB/tRNA1(Val) A37 N6-methylase TrmN6